MSARPPEVAGGAWIWRRRRLVASIATAGMVAGAVVFGLFLGWVAAVGFACIAFGALRLVDDELRRRVLRRKRRVSARLALR